MPIFIQGDADGLTFDKAIGFDAMDWLNKEQEVDLSIATTKYYTFKAEKEVTFDFDINSRTGILLKSGSA